MAWVGRRRSGSYPRFAPICPVIADKVIRCFLGSRVRGNDGVRVVFSDVIPANAGTQ
ncbi:hypothetical protein PCLA_02f0087 [Pseudomonas citronellolis]|nr:hypothetical protein PCLA_02f0087 [Pseudomonas citronellolis]